MQAYLPLIGIAFGLAVITMFIASFFGRRRARNLGKLIGGPDRKARR